MFAGIYYGGMYGGSTTSILLNTPGESASVMTAIEGNKMAKRGRAAQALATAAIGSFVAGTIGTLLVVFFAPALADIAVEIGAPSYFAIMLLAMVLVTSVLGSSRLRGFIALFLGLTIGLVGLDLNTGQARLSFDQPLLADRLDIVVVAVGIFALGEALWVAAHLRRKPLEIIPVGQPWMGRDGLGALLEAVAARHRDRLPVRRGAGRRRRDPDVPVLHPRAPAGQATARSSARARSRASPARRPPTTPPPPARFVPLLALGLPVTATADDHAGRDAELRHPARPAADDRAAGPGLDAAGQPADRQHAAAGAQPAAGAAVGEAAADPAPLPLRRHPVLRLARRLHRQLQAFDLFLLLVFGLLGLAMRRFALPVLPLILGVILGPLMETSSARRWRSPTATCPGCATSRWRSWST